MLSLQIANSLMLALILLALSYNIQTAPTHHLTIGVQGNTPTLMVTSSEIGITAETMGSMKKPEYLTKSHKHVDIKKKWDKMKLTKNQAAFNKKDKLQNLTKPLIKQTSLEKENDIENNLKTTTETLKSLKKDQEPKDIKTETTTNKWENFELTTLDFKEINNKPLITTQIPQETIITTTPQDSLKLKTMTTTTTLKPKYVNIPTTMSANLNPKNLNDISTTTVINYPDIETTKTPAISHHFTKTQIATKVNKKDDNDDVSQTEILQDTTTFIKIQNENDNDSYILDPVAVTKNNENLLLTSIETKAFTNTPIVTTTVDTTTDSTTDLSSNTLRDDNSKAAQRQQELSLSSLTITSETGMVTPMTTTENIIADNDKVDNSEQQKTTTEFVEIDKTSAFFERTINKEAKQKDNKEILKIHNVFATLKTNVEYTTEAIVKTQIYENDKTSENPNQATTSQQPQSNATSSEIEKNRMESVNIKEKEIVSKFEYDNYATTTAKFPEDFTPTHTTTISKRIQTPVPKIDETSKEPENYETTKATESSHDIHTTIESQKTTSTQTDETSLKPETTTEAVLKLIDLEQHVLKTIDDLKQSSLLMSGQHDNGHDGLKNIKKKQLVDKHYIEALLHNKQDVHVKDTLENEKYLPLTTQGIETTSAIPATTTSTTTNKPLLMPIKHGYLGPILMEEKTFHVIHHPDHKETNKKHHKTDIEDELRKHHFVELKVKTEFTENPLQNKENLKDLKPMEHWKNKDDLPVQKDKLIVRDELEMQSDQPAAEPEKSLQFKEKYSKFEQFKEHSKFHSKFSNKQAKNLKPAQIRLSLSSEKILEPQIFTTTKEIIEPTEHSPIDLSEDLKTPTEISKSEEVTKKIYLEYNKPQMILTTTEIIAKESSHTIKPKEDYKSSMEILKSSDNFKPKVLLTTTEKTVDEILKSSDNFKPKVLLTTTEKTVDETELKQITEFPLRNFGTESNVGEEYEKLSDLKEETKIPIEYSKSVTSSSQEIVKPRKETEPNRKDEATNHANLKEQTESSTGNLESLNSSKQGIVKPNDLKTDLPFTTEIPQAETTTILEIQQSTDIKEDPKSSKEKIKLDEIFSEVFNTTTTKENTLPNTTKTPKEIITPLSPAEIPQQTDKQNKSSTVLSTTVFQVMDSVATKTPIMQADTLFTSEDKENPISNDSNTKEQTESKISDIQIEVYDSTIDSIVASTNFKDAENKKHNFDESSLGKTTKPPVAAIQQERFTQYVIDRAETSTHEPINYSTIQVASGKPEPAAIEIHINVSESFGNESEDLEFSYPQSEYNNNNNNERIGELLYEDSKVNDNIKLKIPSNSNNNGKDMRNDEILVVEIIDTDNITDATFKEKHKTTDDLFISDSKDHEATPPPPPPPPPYQTNFDRDSDTIFYISNTEVKVGESLPNTKTDNEERKLKLESQFFPANYIASTHPNINNREESNNNHHIYEEDIILSSSRNQADSLKIYRNRNEPSPPLDVTYVGESIIEVEQSPDTVLTTTYAPDQQHNPGTPQADVIIQPAILPEISIGVPVIGELPPQIELKEIDFMPNEAQLHRSGIYDDNDIDDNTINAGSNSNREADIANGNSNNNINQRVDESSIQYGGDLIDESADGGFDGVEGSYPFGNPAAIGKSSSSPYTSAFMAKLRKQQQQQQQPNHVADYAHLYVNYGVNNMRKDELSADVKDSGETMLVGSSSGDGRGNIASNEQNITNFKDFLLNNNNKVSMNNSNLLTFMSANLTQNERMSNATAFSVMEDANDLEDKNAEDIINLISLAIGLFIVILPVVVTCSLFWALRYLYIKYHSNLTDNGGYAEQTEIKVPLDDDGVEKGEFVYDPSSSPTNSNKDAIEKYPETSNKPSTTDTSNISVKFSTEKSSNQLETSNSNTNISTTTTTNITMTTNSSCATTSKTNDTLKLSLALSSPLTQVPPLASASSSSNVVIRNSSEHIQTVQNDVDIEDGVHDANDDDDDNNDDVVEMPGPNGSITKMTLENNLLIVETEERNDISRVARETKMDYNKDGVFVVEVARGIDSKTIPESPVTEGSEKMLSMFDTKQNNGGIGYKISNEKNCINNEKVQIHSPPPENPEEGPRSLHQIEEVEEPTNSPQLNENSNDEEIIGLAYKANTGLSQSDLSTTSSNDSNKAYCYGNQELYVVEQSGYASASPASNIVLKCDVKDIKDDDRNPGNDHYLKHSPARREESKEKEDIVESTRNTEEGGKRTNSGESPASKQTDKEEDKSEGEGGKRTNSGESPASKQTDKEEDKSDAIVIEENKENLSENQSEVKESNINLDSNEKDSELPSNCNIPVEIEVHITPAQLECTKVADEETLPEVRSSECLEPAHEEYPKLTEKVENTLTDVKNSLPILEATESVTEPLILETISAELDDDLAAETFPEIDINISSDNESLAVKVEEANDNTDEVANLAVNDAEIYPDNVKTEQDSIALENSANQSVDNVVTNKVCQEVELTEVEKKLNVTNEEALEKHTEQNSQYDSKEEVKLNDESSEATKETSKATNKDDLQEPAECVSNIEAERNPETSVAITEILEAKNEKIPTQTDNKEESNTNKDNSLSTKVILETQESEPEGQGNGLELNGKSLVHMNGVTEEYVIHKEDIDNPTEAIEDEQQNSETLNGFIHSDMESLTNGSTTLPDLVTELKSPPHLQNGHADVEPISSSFTDMENGYDSIMSLPEPPITTDEPLISDLSEQQLDSLPPPPPPEIFNLKDLPPPLTNGNAVDSPQSEESNNFYNTLPPPPPTTLEVCATETTNTTPATATTNGKVHASPLTPPASPPAHYTNNLHAGLCSQPIAVDVNGS